MRKIALLPLAGLVLLAACGSKETEEAPVDNNTVVEEPANIAEVNTATPEPENVTNEVKPAPPPKVSEEQQTLDDADATGLTSRLSQDDAHAGHGDAANQAVPAAQ